MSLLKETVTKSVNYEVTIADIARRSERRAWRVATAASLMSLILAGGYFHFLPLKEKVPYLIMADAYSLYVQSYDRLKQLSTELGFKDESAYVNAAASIAAEAKAQNLKRVDHVLLSTHGLSLFAVQGKTDDPGNHWVQIDKAAAVSHAVQLSTIEVDVLRQKRQEELSLDTEFRAAMTR